MYSVLWLIQCTLVRIATCKYHHCTYPVFCQDEKFSPIIYGLYVLFYNMICSFAPKYLLVTVGSLSSDCLTTMLWYIEIDSWHDTLTVILTCTACSDIYTGCTAQTILHRTYQGYVSSPGYPLQGYTDSLTCQYVIGYSRNPNTNNIDTFAHGRFHTCVPIQIYSSISALNLHIWNYSYPQVYLNTLIWSLLLYGLNQNPLVYGGSWPKEGYEVENAVFMTWHKVSTKSPGFLGKWTLSA